MNKKEAIIYSIGAQNEQVKYSLKKFKPNYVGFLATNTNECRRALDEIPSDLLPPRTHIKIEYFADTPKSIGNVIEKFLLIYNWFTEEMKISLKQIAVDLTGGRKWMSSALAMICSQLDLDMYYVDVKYIDGKIDPKTMRMMSFENAYQQLGILEEREADNLLNNFNFNSAREIYLNLMEKSKDPRRIEIKYLISSGLQQFWEFYFVDACKNLQSALGKIERYKTLRYIKPQVKRLIRSLKVLKKNDEEEFYLLLKDKEFVEIILCFLYFKACKYGASRNFDEAILIFYRILELISQHRLAFYHNIDTKNVPDKVRASLAEQFKKAKKEVDNTISEVPKQIALYNGWILLYCLGDPLVKDDLKSIKRLKGKTEPRNLMWLEHGNRKISEKEFEDYKQFVEHWLEKFDKKILGKAKSFEFVKF